LTNYTFNNYLIRLNICATPDVDIPSCLAVSANDTPCSLTRFKANVFLNRGNGGAATTGLKPFDCHPLVFAEKRYLSTYFFGIQEVATDISLSPPRAGSPLIKIHRCQEFFHH
jgi:hypothetical protein